MKLTRKQIKEGLEAMPIDTLLMLLSLYCLEFIGFFASLLCFILAGAYVFLAIRGEA